MGKLIDVDAVANEIDNMPTVVDANGAKYIEKTCLGIRINALPPAQLAQDLTKGCTDTISRAAVVDVIKGVDWYHQNQHGEMVHGANDDEHQAWYKAEDIYKAIESVPSAQPEPLSDVYTKAVWTWLIDYQIKAAELKGRYTPYEVLSWVVNDWRKEHERSD